MKKYIGIALAVLMVLGLSGMATGSSLTTTFAQTLTLQGSMFTGIHTISVADFTANQAQFSQGTAVASGTAYDLKYGSACRVRYGTSGPYASIAASRTLKDGFYVKATGPGSNGWVNIPKPDVSVNILAHSILVSTYSFSYLLQLNQINWDVVNNDQVNQGIASGAGADITFTGTLYLEH